MRWERLRKSKNVQDNRGRRAAAGGFKISGIVVVIAIVFGLITGQNPLALLQVLGGGGSPAPSPTDSAPSQTGTPDEASEFIRAVLGSTEDVWGQLFASAGQQYQPPQLVLFTQAVRSACGLNSAAVGPFYCPGDRKVYMDLGFFQQLARMGGQGDFAQAYVVGHEVGHHIQNITGIEPRVRRLQSGSRGQPAANQLSVLMELQADCLAGVWAHHADRKWQVLEPGDVEEGLRAAAAIGDDRLQSSSGGQVRPESFTHGTSQQRVQWLKKGLSSGDFDGCDTFGAAGVRL